MADAMTDDLAYLRQVTEAARSAPLLGGRFLLFWGVLVSAAWAGQWAILSGAAGLPLWSIAVLWSVFGVVAVLGVIMLSRSIRRKPGQGALGNVVERSVWSGAGAAIGAYAGGTIVAAGFGIAPVTAYDTILAVAFALYGTAFLATSAASGQSWLRMFAALAFTGAGVVPFFLGDPLVYLISAVIVLVVAAVPGAILLTREPGSLPQEVPA